MTLNPNIYKHFNYRIMRKKLVLVLILVVGVVYAQTGKEKPWDYPVKLNTEKWVQLRDQLKTVEERRAVFQIPEDILSSLSTEDLTDICLDYPFLITDFIGTSHERALDRLFETFNGISELVKRKDAVNGLVLWYENAVQNLSFLNGDASNIQKGRFTYEIIVAELLLGRCQLPDDAGKDDYAKTVGILLSCYEKMHAYPESFGGYSFGVNCYSRAKIISRMDARIYEKIPRGSENPLFTMAEPDTQAMRVIDEWSYEIINQK
jgi:hypothetical protein